MHDGVDDLHRIHDAIDETQDAPIYDEHYVHLSDAQTSKNA